MSSANLNTQELGDLVRHWVHYDNLTSSLQKQTQNVRKLRDSFEDKILQNLHSAHMENAIIQIQGGKLVVADERHTSPLSLVKTQELLHKYFSEKHPGKADETGEIMKFLKAQRTVEVTKRLKKQANLTAPPALPPATNNL
jgi:hypothetical protein